MIIPRLAILKTPWKVEKIWALKNEVVLGGLGVYSSVAQTELLLNWLVPSSLSLSGSSVGGTLRKEASNVILSPYQSASSSNLALGLAPKPIHSFTFNIKCCRLCELWDFLLVWIRLGSPSLFSIYLCNVHWYYLNFKLINTSNILLRTFFLPIF